MSLPYLGNCKSNWDKIKTCSHLKGDEFINTFYNTGLQPKAPGWVAYQVNEMKNIDSYDSVGSELIQQKPTGYKIPQVDYKKYMNYTHKYYHD